MIYNMKKILYLLVLVLMPMCFVACGDDDDDGGSGSGGRHDSRLVGTWCAQHDWSGGTTTVYRFDADGKCYYNEWWKNDRPEPKLVGPWETNDGFITIYYAEDSRVKNHYRYELSSDGKTLYFYGKDDNGEYTKQHNPYINQ